MTTYNGLPLIKEYPKHHCQCCGKPVGHLGNFLAKIFGNSFHNCDFSNVKTPEEYRQFVKRNQKALLSL